MSSPRTTEGTAHPRRSRIRQFTLIELLVVVAIIAILASLLLPALHSAKKMAESAECLNRYKQLGLAVFNYQDENDGFYPVCAVGELKLDFLTQLGPYIDPGQDNYANSVGMWNSKNGTSENLFLCPSSDYQPGYSSTHIYANWATISSWRVHNYFMNVHFGWNTLTTYPQGGPRKGFSTSAELLAMMGEIYGSNQRWPRYDFRWVPRSGLFRHHGDSTNLLYLDGHAANAGSVDVMERRWKGGEIVLRPTEWY